MTKVFRCIILSVFILASQFHIQAAGNPSAFFASNTLHSCERSGSTRYANQRLCAQPTWKQLESVLGEAFQSPSPHSIDSVLSPETPKFSTARPTLFRERHGWCPYSERVWLALEIANIEYDTIRIDNTGGPRPRYYSGQTPQVKWPDGRTQSESMDLVHEIDKRYSCGFQSQDAAVQGCVKAFRNIFPRARPSSRAAFLFQMNGEPLWRSTFESTLQQTDELLAKTTGPFFCGSDLTTADLAWAPFLERYRYQLPCLHAGLQPDCAESYPRLSAWYSAMDRIPAYACRVKGDAGSWRKVLSMAGFGNAGTPPAVARNMEELVSTMEIQQSQTCLNQDVWEQYTKDRPYLLGTPAAHAAMIICENREAIVRDTVQRASKGQSAWPGQESAPDESTVESALMGLAQKLLDEKALVDDAQGTKAMAAFLDQRMCVPRDMGAMSAASIKLLALD